MIPAKPPEPKFRAGTLVNATALGLYGSVHYKGRIARGVYNDTVQHVSSPSGFGFVAIPTGWIYIMDAKDPKTGKDLAFHEKDVTLAFEPAKQSFDELLNLLRNEA